MDIHDFLCHYALVNILYFRSYAATSTSLIRRLIWLISVALQCGPHLTEFDGAGVEVGGELLLVPAGGHWVAPAGLQVRNLHTFAQRLHVPRGGQGELGPDHCRHAASAQVVTYWERGVDAVQQVIGRSEESLSYRGKTGLSDE